MKIIVTGGAGFVGSHLVDRLLADGVDEVVVIDNLVRGRRDHLASHATNPALQFVEGDIRDEALLCTLFADATYVMHLAAQSNVLGAVTDLPTSFTTNVAGTVAVLRAAQQCGVQRVVFSSSREVYGEVAALPVAETAPLAAKNAYGASKAAGELYARVFWTTYGLQTVILRLANVYGPRDTGRVIPLWLGAVAKGDDLIVYGGKQVIDFVWIDQVVEALVRALTVPYPDTPINVGSGQGIPLLALAERIRGFGDGRSQLLHQSARTVEVARFVADVGLMRQHLHLEPPADPLFALPHLWAAQER